MKLASTIALSGLLITSMSAHADFFGTLSGRSANPANSPQLSVEGSFTTSSDYQNLGARLNYTVNESLTVYGDFGQSEYGPSGSSFGAGVFYYLPNLSEASEIANSLDFAIQASYHTAGLDDFDFTALGAAMLISPKEAFNPDNGMNWYANVGLTRRTFEFVIFRFTGDVTGDDSDIELQLGGGIYLPIGPGTFYAGADLIDEFIFGAGYRYGFR